MHRRDWVLGGAMVGLMTLAVGAVGASAQDGARPLERTVSVAATGSAAATPDRAVISTGVMTDAATAREAMTANGVTMKKLIDGLKAQRIEAKDIQTTQVHLSPRYADGRAGRAPTIAGYQAVNQVRITVREVARLGDILDAAVTLGANQMGGISFEISRAEELKDEARKAAMGHARRRAELYAAAAGASLGPVLTISESVSSGPQPRVFAGRAAVADAVPVEAGSVDLNVQVHVTYGLR